MKIKFGNFEIEIDNPTVLLPFVGLLVILIISIVEIVVGG